MNTIIWGICLIFIGIGMIGNFTGLFNILFKGWWTIFIIFPAVIDLFSKKNTMWSLTLISIGAALLLQQQGLISGSLIWKVLLSAWIIILGINMIINNSNFHKTNKDFDIIDKNNLNKYNAVFSGQELKYDNEPFNGAIINAVFGGVKLNLRDAIIDKDVIIKIDTVFGGCEITVPNNINIKIDNSGVFGGVTNKVQYNNPDSPTLYIQSNTVFGGIDIK